MTISVENVLLFSCLVFFVTGIVIAACSDRVTGMRYPKRGLLSLTGGHAWTSVR